MTAPPPRPSRAKPVYARLPLAPEERQPGAAPDQPVPFHRAGEYGDRSYPGNCGGNLIKDLLRVLQARRWSSTR